MKPNFCSECGYQLTEVKKYCSNCGNSLGISPPNDVFNNTKSVSTEYTGTSNFPESSNSSYTTKINKNNDTPFYKKWWFWAGLIFFLGIISRDRDVLGMCFLISGMIAWINGIIRKDGWLRKIFVVLVNSKHWKVISVIIIILMIILRILHTMMKEAHR